MNCSTFSFPALLLVLVSAVSAQPVPTKLPDSVAIFPAGARRGSTVDVRVVTEQAPPGTRFFIRGTGVEGSSLLEEEIFDNGQSSPRRPPTEVPVNYPRQWKAQVRVADNALTGTVLWDTFCAAGGSSGSLPFVIGDLPEVVEKESNSTREHAHQIEIPVTVNGQIHGERDLDYYGFDLRTGEEVHIEVLARRLGSIVEPVLAVVSPSGTEFTLQRAFLGDDQVAAFKAPADGRYLLRVGNVSVQGSPAHVYRINLTHRAVPLSIFPVSVPAGQTTMVEVLTLSGDSVLQKFDVPVRPEAGSDRVLLTDDRITGMRRVNVTPAQLTVAESREVAPDQVLNARLPPGQPLVCKIPVTEQTPLMVQVVIPDGLSGAQIVSAELSDPSGTIVKRFLPAAVTGSIKIQHSFQAQAGDYKLVLRSHGAPRFQPSTAVCQIRVTGADAGFELRAGRDCVGITQGTTLKLPLTAVRTGGFAEDIEVTVNGLPDGIVAEQVAIQKGTDQAELVLKANDDVPTGRYVVQINGTAVIDDASRTSLARMTHRGHDSTGVGTLTPFSTDLVLTIRHKPLFRLYCLEAYQYAHRGTVYPYGMTLERLNGFRGTVNVQQADRQNRDLDGIEFPETRLQPEKSDFMMPIYLPETMHINIQSQSQLYTQAWTRFTDSTGTQHSFIAVAEKRNMIRTLPTVIQLRAKDQTIQCRPGQTIPVEFNIRRTSNMRNELTLTCRSSPDSGLTSAPVQIEAGAVTASASISIPEDMKPGIRRLRFRATGRLDTKPDHQVITEAETLILVLAHPATRIKSE